MEYLLIFRTITEYVHPG